MSLASEHYEHAREVPGQGTCGIFRFLFTTGLVVGITDDVYARRYCFGEYGDAVRALAVWDGAGDPPGPWIKEKPSGRLGPGSRPADWAFAAAGGATQ